MADWNEPRRTQQGFGAPSSLEGDLSGRAIYDVGLRAHMLSIYNYMASAVLLSGVIALLFARSGLAISLVNSPMYFVVAFAPLGIVLAMSFGRNKFGKKALQTMFWAFAVLMGMSLSSIFLIYTGGSIAATFFATAGAFAGLSLFGYTTKKDLTGFGSFLIMGVVGLLIASVLNMWLQSEALSWGVSFLGVLIFAGLTAWRTQMLKNEYVAVDSAPWSLDEKGEYLAKAAIQGALGLYLDFINMFLFLLRFMGSRD